MQKAASLRGSEAQQGVGEGAGRVVSCCDTEWRQADASSGAISATLLHIFLIHPLSYHLVLVPLIPLVSVTAFDFRRGSCRLLRLEACSMAEKQSKGQVYARPSQAVFRTGASSGATAATTTTTKPFIWSAARRDAYIENERECAKKKERLMDEGESKE